MINDRKIVISVGASRKSINWQRQELNFSDFIGRLKKPIRSTETLETYLKMSKTKQDELKDIGGFVGGSLKGLRRKSDSVEFRDLITLDFDNIISGGTSEVIKRVMTLGCSYVIYSTRKHASYKPRLRIILPTDRSVSPDEYEPIARFMAKTIGIEMADPTTFEASRLMYWPSCSCDSEYVFKYEDKPLLSADGILNKYDDWKDISSWPQVPGSEVSHRKLITRQQDPTSKNGIIRAFVGLMIYILPWMSLSQRLMTVLEKTTGLLIWAVVQQVGLLYMRMESFYILTMLLIRVVDSL